MRKINDVRKEEFIFLYNLGLTDCEIAEKMQLSDSTIFRWRRSMSLPAYNIKRKLLNKAVELTQEQKEILCGTLLGDSSLSYYPNHRHSAPHFKCDHGALLKEYALLLYRKFKSLGARFTKYLRIDKRNNKEYITYNVSTKVNPAFMSFYNELYKDGHKEITLNFLLNFTIISLAYLYMDDGYADLHTAYICTDCFSLESILTLIDYISINFDLHFTKVKYGKYNRLRLSLYDFSRFYALINPYIINSLKYKLNSVS